jgi:hypothetical protein
MSTIEGLVTFIGWNGCGRAVFVANHYSLGGEWEPEIVEVEPGSGVELGRGMSPVDLTWEDIEPLTRPRGAL